jgi:uncharacterized protein YegP (UPF0339 family)
MGKKVEAARAQVYYRWDSWRFRVKGANGEVIAQGEAYKAKRDAVAAARALLPEGAPVEVTERGA